MHMFNCFDAEKPNYFLRGVIIDNLNLTLKA